MLGHPITWAKFFQYAGHSIGAALAVLLLARLLRSGALRRWYGLSPDPAFDMAPASVGKVRFWTVTFLGTASGAAWAIAGVSGLPALIIRFSLGVAAGLVVASTVCATEVKPLTRVART